MKLKLYLVKDVAIGRFNSAPFMLENDVVAKRCFSTAINSGSQSQVVMYYKDMQLFRIGEFNDITGEITPDYDFICSGVDVKEISTTGVEDGNSEELSEV